MPNKESATQGDSPQVGFIYLITNIVNGKRYIGQTVRPLSQRWSSHVYGARHRQRIPVARAIAKYGVENFTMKPIAMVASLDRARWLDFLEAQYIEAYHTFAPSGYNVTSGGKSGKLHATVRAKIGNAHRGKAVSEETRARLSAWPRTAETRAKMSAAQYRINAEAGGKRSRRKPTAASRLKMSLSHQGKKQSAETKAKRIASIKAALRKKRERAAFFK